MSVSFMSVMSHLSVAFNQSQMCQKDVSQLKQSKVIRAAAEACHAKKLKVWLHCNEGSLLSKVDFISGTSPALVTKDNFPVKSTTYCVVSDKPLNI